MEEKANASDTLVANGAGDKASDEQHAEAKEKLATPENPADMKAPSSIPFPSARLMLTMLGFFGMVNCYTLRVNLSVAIVAMVNSTWVLEQEAAAKHENATTHHNPCITGNETESKDEDENPGPFKWDTETQTLILAAFFYGYTTTQILGGTLAQKIGGKVLMLFGVAWTAVLTLFLPVLTNVGGFGAIFALRLLMGMGEAVTYPSMAAMLSKWAPPLERSKMTTFIYAGGQIGTVLGMPISGFCCQWWGWESVFYFFGALGVAWSIMWFFLCFDTPAKHPRISTVEREYIEKALSTKPGAKATLRVPWCEIAKCVPLYALAVAHFTCNIGYYTLLTCLPLYFKYILHFDIKSNGLVSGAPYFFMWLFLVIAGFFADLLRAKGLMSTTNVRKMMNSIGFVIPAILMIGTGYVDCNALLAVVLITAAVGFAGVSFAGWAVNHLDLAPPYAGTLMGLTNTIATTPGFIGPAVVGVITNNNQTVEAWRLVFYLGAAVYAFGTIFYCILGSGEVQPWAEPKRKEELLQSLDAAEKANLNKDKETEKEVDPKMEEVA